LFKGGANIARLCLAYCVEIGLMKKSKTVFENTFE
jgi:hypothetical protein